VPNLPTPEQWHPLLRQLVADRAALPAYTTLKYSNHAEVFRTRFESSGGSFDLIVKQTRPCGFRNRLAGAFRMSREHRSFYRALMLLEAGVNTPLPLAMLERRSPRPEAWLVTEFVPDLVDLDQVALRLLPQWDRNRAFTVKTLIVKAIVDLLERLERHGLRHRDLKASNIMLSNAEGAGDPPTIWLVDLEGLRRRRLITPLRRWQPVVRLAASLLGYATITRTDYCRFLKAYLPRQGEPTAAWKRYFGELSRQAGDYVRRARRRKRHKLDGYTGD
jgi:tRNA A-37 threonylcarbamoyl transferase component Bud32